MASLWRWQANSIGTLPWYGSMRFDYDEVRAIALAPKTGILDYLAFVDRGDVLRIISLRRANRREVRHYVQSF